MAKFYKDKKCEYQVECSATLIEWHLQTCNTGYMLFTEMLHLLCRAFPLKKKI